MKELSSSKRISSRLMACLAAITCAVALTSCSGGDSGDQKQLNVYAWAGELPDSVVQAFQKETGITVTVDTFDSNETMTAKLAAGNSGYDIVEPSQYAVQLLAKQGLVEQLDSSRIKGMGNVQARFANPNFDPGNAHAVPWVWGTTGLLYNLDCTGGTQDSWSTLFNPAYRGKLYMLDNMLASYIVALQSTGASATSKNEAEINRATDKL
ncbi:MAG: ABC transporter substrate-binding protein, partial [Mycobacterium sp.]